ncbi:MAG TPA: cytochrome c biogenesis protein ResB [Candidatus Acidoferrales bacterium]|nr:cytochrome c biogenesis protein ResB [Candidatus Acidoferrales bacterium]
MSSARTLASSNRPLLDEILDLLSNVMFPVVVFLIWAVATTIGTVVDQNQPEQHYYDFYPLPLANAIVRLHLTNVFHSVPYISLVVLLLVSMSVCTFRRVIPKRFPKDRAVPIRNFGLHAELASAETPERADEAARAYLAAKGFGVRHDRIDGAHWIFGDKQKWARYGVLVAHLGFTVIAFGVFLGWLRGFSGQALVFKGQSASIAPAGLRLHLDDFTATFVPIQTPNGPTYQAQKFQSNVTFTDARGATERAQILVNHPHVTSAGVYVYQASYNFAGNLRVTRNGKPATLQTPSAELGPQDAIFLPGTSRAIEYGTLLGPSDPSQTPPGIPLPSHDEYALWVFHDNIPTTDRPVLLPVGSSLSVGDGYTITALPPTPSSGFTYRYDPGQGWVGLGALILVAGFVMALFFVPVKLYVKVAQSDAGCSVEVAATTTKGNAIYEDGFGALIAGLRGAVATTQNPRTRPDRQVEAYA